MQAAHHLHRKVFESKSRTMEELRHMYRTAIHSPKLLCLDHGERIFELDEASAHHVMKLLRRDLFVVKEEA